MGHTQRMFDRARWTASRFLRRLADRLQPWAFLDARQAEGGVAPLDVDAVIEAYCAATPEFFFVQIGANEGGDGDPLLRTARALRLRGILVEPQGAAFDRLSAAYADQLQIHLERAAIAAVDGTATLYTAREAFWSEHGFPGSASEIASLDPGHVRRHVALFGGETLARTESAYLETEEVPALTLASLVGKHRVERLDFLQVDAEGFDFEVLKMIDWRRLAPGMIHFETVHLSSDDRQAAWTLLRSHDYALFAPNSYNTLAIRRRPISSA